MNLGSDRTYLKMLMKQNSETLKTKQYLFFFEINLAPKLPVSFFFSKLFPCPRMSVALHILGTNADTDISPSLLVTTEQAQLLFNVGKTQ